MIEADDMIVILHAVMPWQPKGQWPEALGKATFSTVDGQGGCMTQRAMSSPAAAAAATARVPGGDE